MDSDPTARGPTGSVSGARHRSAKHAAHSATLERRVRLFSLLTATPGFVLAAILLWQLKVSSGTAAMLLGGVALISLILAGLLLEQVVRPLQTLANVVSALRESDYSFRARGAAQPDALGELALEINEFADLLQGQRLGEMEATALLRCVISSMDAPVLAFDPEHRLRLLNPAAESIFHVTAQRALGSTAADLQLSEVLEQPDRGILVIAAKGNPVQWMIRRSGFRQRGIPHTLLVLSDVSIALREQERDAWQRLIRVMGHEINNSLTPIKSIAGSLRTLLSTHAQELDIGEDRHNLDRGLTIIESRAESLNRFIQAYRQLAQLPPPVLQRVALRALIERAVALETRVAIQIKPGPGAVLQLDPDQIEQLVINLLRNAVEAALARFPDSATNGHRARELPEVTITWRLSPPTLVILIEDNGIGLNNPSNLFVPFYTTKPNGSGIGLALARQICEAHGGVLQLANRIDGPGCGAEIRLPMAPARSFPAPDEIDEP